jgi:DNA-binding response OmpR family regulator
MPPRKILIIDDDTAVQNALKAILAKAGYMAIGALDGAQGSMSVRNMKPDLVILDVQMPAGGGVQVYERIRNSTHTFQLPVLVYSVVDKAQVESTIALSPSTAVLQKPAAPEAILAAVQSLLGEAGPS